jgi:glycosyltransferase involved in cell wall biosynthesis
MHEWAPGQRDQYFVWRLMVAPLMDYMCRTYLPKCAAVSTVAESLAREYDRVYGTRAELVRNSRPWEDLEPTPLRADGRLRLVHSGGAEPNRNLTMLIDAAVELEHTTLDLYLVSAGDGGKYLRMLQERAAASDRVTIHDPVPPAELPVTLNAYDVGVFSLPPDNFNMENCLPNKLFDFLQARLAFAVSPSPEMARFVRENELGVVSADYSQDSFVQALRTLTPERVVAAKESAHRHAKGLSSDTDVAASHAIVRRLLGG